jgi:hypothetical protein
MKRQITNSAELHQAVQDLERRVKVQEVEIKANYEQVKENLKLKNVMKNKFEQIAQTPEMQRTLINTAFGIVLGFAFKKVQELLTEESMNRTVENIMNRSLNQLEQSNPDSWVSKAVTLVRKYTPTDSPIYPLVKYRNTY